MDNVMVKMWINGDCVALTTYCRRHGRRGRFLLLLKEMKEWLLEDYGGWDLMDEDCGNVISLHVSGGTVYVQVWWLSAYDLDDVGSHNIFLCLWRRCSYAMKRRLGIFISTAKFAYSD